MHCRTCNTVIEKGETLCPVCEEDYTSGTNYCPGCGKKTSSREVLCFKCGHDLSTTITSFDAFRITSKNRGLYRSSDQGLITGFFAGLSHKFNLNSTFLRTLSLITQIALLYVNILSIVILPTAYIFSLVIPSISTKSS
jgi:phage shock protein PspC (stress-responsive transcriptional regulator)/RNA polymerase subunit RPABC4/transcription elongation factor Spt4